MGDLGLPGSVVEMTDDAPQKSAVGSAQGRAQHHDEHEGRRQAGQLHRGLRGAARAPGRLHRRADRGVRAGTAPAAPGTRTPRSARCTCGRSSTCAATARRRCARSPRKPRALVRKYKGAYTGEHGDGLCRGEWIAWQFGPRHRRGVRARSRTCSTRAACSNPGKIVDPPQMDDARAVPLPAGLHGRSRCSRRSTGRRGTCRTIRSPKRSRAPGTGGDADRRLRQGRRDVQQQRPLPQVRRRHDVPELPRHARRAAPDARPRQHAAPRACPASSARMRFTSEAVHEALDLCVSCKGCKRDCPTGVDMARMKIEFLAHYKAQPRLHAEGPADRASAGLRARPPAACRGC